MLCQFVVQDAPILFGLAAKIDREHEIVVVVILRAPEHALIASLLETLGSGLELRVSRAFRTLHLHQRIGAGSARIPELRGRSVARPRRRYCKSRGADSGILHNNVVNDRRHVLGLVRQADPGNAWRLPLVRFEENRLPLHEPGRWAGPRLAAGTLVWACPGAPVVFRSRGVAGANIKFHFALRRAIVSPPCQPSPAGKNLGVESLRFKASVR